MGAAQQRVGVVIYYQLAGLFEGQVGRGCLVTSMSGGEHSKAQTVWLCALRRESPLELKL